MLAPSRRAILVSLLALALGACNATTNSTATTPVSTSSNAAPSNEPSPSAETSGLPLAGQTDTDWGRIWDSLPVDFPRYPGVTPADAAASGPASAVFAVQGSQGLQAMRIADWTRSNLELASYSTEALSGPLEDGSFVLDSTGPAPGCRVEVSIAPLGGLTIVTVLYGASCPQP